MREHVDLPTLDALDEEWRQHPPVHHLVAAYLDYKPAGRSGAGVDVSDDIAPLLGETGTMPMLKAPAVDTSAFDAALAKHKEAPDG